MNLTILVFYFLLEEITEKDIDYYNQRLDSTLRQLIYQGFFVKNFQDKVQWN